MKKTISLLLLAVIFALANNSTTVQAKVEAENQRIREIAEAQSKVMGKFNDVYLKVNENSVFHEIFGGAYFDEENFYINVKEGNTNVFKGIFKHENEYNYKEVKYTLKNLIDYKDLLAINMVEYGIHGIKVDQRNNILLIEVNLLTNELETLLNETLPSDIYSIEESVSDMVTHVKYTTNGERFTINGAGCTVGFAAKNSSGDPGFVTAGHCVTETGSSNGTNVYYNGSHAGDVSGYKFQSNSNIDAAFIKLRDPWIGHTWLPTKNFIDGGSYQSATYSSAYIAPGMITYFYGTFTADNQTCNYARESGEILYTYASVTVGGKLLHNQIITDHVTHLGDSGGPLAYWRYVGSASAVYDVMGVLSGGNSTISVFSSVQYILPELGLSQY